ncbi:MAG TPA: hypothetical protein VK034_16255, partial [Enhygromyxa sp.]|nr:hypothetical protein [Enhygromyxa sp.]
ATAAPTGRAGKLVGRIVQELALRVLSGDVRQDFDIWKHRSHLEQPALAPGDGPIGQYRRWARQFDPRCDPRDGAEPISLRIAEAQL